MNEIDQIDETVKNFWDIHQKKMMKWYFDQKKDSDLIISASPEFLLREICEREHITHLIASDVDKYTGVFYSENCHDKMKVVYFKEKFPNGTVYEFYSDSKSDEPMARIANKAFLVKRGAICSWSVGGDL